MKRLRARLPLLTLLLFLMAFVQSALGDTVVQIPLGSVLNTRSVTTLTNGALVTWQIGIDGGGNGNGYLTSAASLFKGDKNLKALPDSGKIPGDARHPEVTLNFSNADGAGNQTRYMPGAGEFTFSVPQGKYSKLFLFFTSAEGASSLQLKLTYVDSSETRSVVMPDYYNDIKPDDPVLFYLVKDLPKWNKSNTMTEANHHNIDGIELHPVAGKFLTGVTVSKTAAGYLVFWGATGIATTPVAIVRQSRFPSTRSGRRPDLRFRGKNGKFVTLVGREIPTYH